MPEDQSKTPTLFGRQKSKKLSPRQQRLVDDLLPKLKIDPDQGTGELKQWCKAKPIWLEIGFGGGEHLKTMAACHKDVNFIGCEPFLNGIAKLLVAIEEQQLENIRIYDNDARHILNILEPESLDRVYILYPDPWPKKRHRKRRFVTSENLKLIAKVMKPGADLIIASDIEDYIKTSLMALEQCNQFNWAENSKNHLRTPPTGWPSTRYEQKALREGRTPTYLKLKKTCQQPNPGL